MTRKIGVLVLFQLFVLSCAVVAQTAPTANDWKAVEQALGRLGQLQGDGPYKFGLPRGDLKVTVDGVQVKPTLALGSWVAFSNPGQDAMLMGDLVLAEDEVSPVMLALQENGLQITPAEWNSGHCASQSHAPGRATPILCAFLGKRRCGEAREGPASSTGQYKLSEMSQENCNDQY